MPYEGMNQTSVDTLPAAAVEGQPGDIGVKDTLSRVCVVAAIKPGRVLIGTNEQCELPDAFSDLANYIGVSLFAPIKEPLPAADGTVYAVGDMVPVERMGRVWLAVKTGSPAANGAVYVYVGATAADRGMVSPTAAASYVLLPGAKFTGNVDTAGRAEVQLNDATAAAQGPAAEQQFTGTLVGGTATVSGLRVTAASKAYPVPSANITGSTNFGSLAHIIASNVVGEAGTGTFVIRALGNDGALDVDAAGTFHGTLKG